MFSDGNLVNRTRLTRSVAEHSGHHIFHTDLWVPRPDPDLHIERPCPHRCMETCFHNRYTLTFDSQGQYLTRSYLVRSLLRVYTSSFEIGLRAHVPSRRAIAAAASKLFYTRCRHSAATDHHATQAVKSSNLPSLPDLISQFLIHQQGLDIDSGEHGRRMLCSWGYFGWQIQVICAEISNSLASRMGRGRIGTDSLIPGGRGCRLVPNPARSK